MTRLPTTDTEALDRITRIMTEPESDRRDVDVLGLEKHRVGVSEDVRGDALGCE